MAVRRQALDRRVASWRTVTGEQWPDDQVQADLERALHEEIGRLPDPYRAPIIACYLEGLSHAQAALQLELAESTIRGRLARARKMLGRRLMRRGVVPSVGLTALTRYVDAAWPLPGGLARATTGVAVSFVNRSQATPSVVSATTRGIADGVLCTMNFSFSPFKIIAVIIVALGIVGAGGALSASRPASVNFTLGAHDEQQAPPDKVDPALAKLAPGPIIRAIPLSKDCMILAYLPDWNFGNVDNIGIGNNDGGVRTLLDWPAVAADEAMSPDRRYFIALFSRKTISHPPASAIHVFEISTDWPERTSWKTQPRYDAEPAGTYEFEPGIGWKLFDVTALIRARAKVGRKGHGVLLRFLNEDVSDRAQEVFSDYKLVSREGVGKWADRRPVLLVVGGSK